MTDDLEKLLRGAYPACYRAARAILRNPNDAEDAVQDAALLAWCHLKDFQGQSSFETWLVRIAVNASLAIRRTRWKRCCSQLPAQFDILNPAPNPEQCYRAVELEALLWRETARIPPTMREPLRKRLRGITGFPAFEATRVHRGKRMLLSRLAALGVRLK